MRTTIDEELIRQAMLVSGRKAKKDVVEAGESRQSSVQPQEHILIFSCLKDLEPAHITEERRERPNMILGFG